MNLLDAARKMAGIALVEPVVDLSVCDLCTRPYPNHPKGCPNWNKKKGCPPGCPLISQTLDLDRPTWAVYNVFDFGAHTARMRAKHGDWSDRQVECCLYWQGTARKQLRKKVAGFLALLCIAHQRDMDDLNKFITVVQCPEGQGVNVTQTMANAGVKLEWPPKTKTVQMVLAGYTLRRV